MKDFKKYIKTSKNGYYCNFRYKGEPIKIQSVKLNIIERKIKEKITKIDNFIVNPEIKNVNKNKFKNIFLKYMEFTHNDFTTIKKKTIIFNIYFDELKDTYINKINNLTLESWYNKIYSYYKNGKIKEDRFNRIISLMEKLISYAKMLDISIPNLNLAILIPLKKNRRRSEKTENNYVTHEELLIFTKAVNELNDNYFKTIPKDYFIFICEFLYYTGMRVNEALATKLKDFRDGDRLTASSYVVVERQIVDNTTIIKDNLKNGQDSRKVYLKKDIFKKFLNILENYKIKDKESFIFDYKQTGIPISRKSFAYTLSKIIKILKEKNKLPITFPDILTPHGFRYSNTLYLKQLGVSPTNAAKMQGHSVRVMLDTYARSDKTEIDNIFS